MTPVARHMSAKATRVARRLPMRAARPPAIGIARIEPTPAQASTMPSSPSESPTRSRTAGMRAAHSPKMRPLRKKIAVDGGARLLGRAAHARTTSMPRSR